MRVLSSSGLVTICLGTLLLGCGTEDDGVDGGDAGRSDTGVTPDTGGGTPDTGTPGGTAYKYIYIVDNETSYSGAMCNSGPGPDIDGIQLKRGTMTIGNGSNAMFVAMPPGMAAAPCTMCGTDMCYYSSTTVANRAEGPKDGMVSSSPMPNTDMGYVSLNTGALWLQIAGGADIRSGDTLTVWEVDKTYIPASAPMSCACTPEKYKVYAYVTTTDTTTRVQLTPTAYRDGNMDCGSPTAAGAVGCGTTDFVVP